jgi:hypothetical protein
LHFRTLSRHLLYSQLPRQYYRRPTKITAVTPLPKKVRLLPREGTPPSRTMRSPNTRKPRQIFVNRRGGLPRPWRMGAIAVVLPLRIVALPSQRNPPPSNVLKWEVSQKRHRTRAGSKQKMARVAMTLVDLLKAMALLPKGLYRTTLKDESNPAHRIKATDWMPQVHSRQFRKGGRRITNRYSSPPVTDIFH